MRSARQRDEEVRKIFETEDLIGRSFGQLLVLRKHRSSRNGGASWICQCNCGRECVAGGASLIRGEKKNCGDCNFGRYIFYSEYAECILPSGAKFQIDLEDYPTVSQYKWVQTPPGYFVASVGRKNDHIFLHRLIVNPPEGMFVDHIDLNKGNCRKSNLRICTKTENNRNFNTQSNNQCGFKGVYWASDRGQWRAEITVDRRHIHLGSFDSAIEAAQVYDRAALEYFGEFAKTNAMLGNYENAKCA